MQYRFEEKKSDQTQNQTNIILEQKTLSKPMVLLAVSLSLKASEACTFGAKASN